MPGAGVRGSRLDERGGVRGSRLEERSRVRGARLEERDRPAAPAVLLHPSGPLRGRTGSGCAVRGGGTAQARG